MASFDGCPEVFHALPLLRLGVLKAPLQLGEGVSKTPIQIMQDGAKPDELELAIRSAILCGNHTAN